MTRETRENSFGYEARALPNLPMALGFGSALYSLRFTEARAWQGKCRVWCRRDARKHNELLASEIRHTIVRVRARGSVAIEPQEPLRFALHFEPAFPSVSCVLR
ncbi:hypothetical protein ZHAS_00009662 [Anopheles sinensis]|uniref:Uncharacterized protein n=1 Tax=Anopheles sinensis TaxID=74873 RepID=A0A084VV29_ANOSI|nr:hypothetical protein ZHAS_00009662 [Anopheles sinensis]